MLQAVDRTRQQGPYRRLAGWHAGLTAFRRDLHAHPEVRFEQKRTAQRVGQGGGAFLHNPRYDFSDEVLPLGAALLAWLVERSLPLSPSV